MDPTKPVFLAKAERERLALERRQAAVSSEPPSTLHLLHYLHLPGVQPPPSFGSDPPPRHTSVRDRDRDRDQDRYTRHDPEDHDSSRPGRDRGRRKRGRDHDRDRPREQDNGDRLEKMAAREREMELDAIKEQYLGSNKPKKRVVAKPFQKSRFSFDWESTEDTSRGNVSQSPLLFGRGFLAGIDRREQKKAAAAAHELRRKPGVQQENHGVDRNTAGGSGHMCECDAIDMPGDRHWSEKAVAEMTTRDWRIFCEDFSISYKGSLVPRPLRSWSQCSLGYDLFCAVLDSGYEKPSPIQMAAIPLGLHQRDVIGVSETGSGKTLAFVLPMLLHISRLPPITAANKDQGPYGLVLVPTRELAQQIEKEAAKLASNVGIRVVSVVGGDSKSSIAAQAEKIGNGCQIVVATPGRLLDLLERRYVVLNQCNYVVIDEADRMIDMGFEPQVASIFDAMPSSDLKLQNLGERWICRTTSMFSATMTPCVERLAKKYLRNPVVVTIGTPGKVTYRIAQNVMMVKEPDKMPLLQRLLRDLRGKTAIVFCNTKKTTDICVGDLERAGFRVTALHGGMSQSDRNISLDGFRNRRFNVLVATEVAARGIDIPDIAHVINYDMPNSIDKYTHRIGRTGRAGKKGVATSFLTLENTDIFFDLKQMLVQSNSHVPHELAKHKASQFKTGSIHNRPPKSNGNNFATH